ncbi:SapB/AmfS family lanthipeptide [Streptomyces cinnamoneus]
MVLLDLQTLERAGGGPSLDSHDAGYQSDVSLLLCDDNEEE